MTKRSHPTSLLTLAFLLFLFSNIVYAKPWSRRSRKLRAKHRGEENFVDNEKRQTDSPGHECASVKAAPIAPKKSNIWNPLSNDDVAGVAEYLYHQKDLNLTSKEYSNGWDNTIYTIELAFPNKTNALAYMDGNSPAPSTYAKVTLVHQATTEPYYQDILVGPLPVKDGVTAWAPFSYQYTRKTQGRIRDLDANDLALYPWLNKIGESVADITQDLWNLTVKHGLTIDGTDPYGQVDGITQWNTFYSTKTGFFDTGDELPLGLCFNVNITGRDPSKWKVLGWWYNDIFYDTVDDLRKAWKSPGFQKLPPTTVNKYEITDQRGPILPFDTNYPPTMVAPSGSRYYVNSTENYIKWMDFEFYLAFTPSTGTRLFDIKYKGQRIIYELGLEEALAHYAGIDPAQSGTSYLDSFYGFGFDTFELVKGYDCPTYATYLNSPFYMDGKTYTHPDSICLFEADAAYPIQRHTAYSYISITKNIYFTLRSVATVGNYDYMFSYEFYMDGSIHVNVRASGYIEAAYYAKNHDYGYVIDHALSGSMHDHVLNYKIDFDILGTANTMQLVNQVPVSQVYSWSNGVPRNTMKLERKILTSEDEGKLMWPPNNAAQYKVVNMDHPNKYGEYRGYRILPSEGTIHLTVQNSSNLRDAVNWATHDLFVLKAHDYEQRSAHPLNNQDIFNPVINFDDYFNGENITQTDIVLWANLGMHHVPHTGDLPNTVFTTAHSGIQLMPLNYLLEDPSRETTNQVRIDYDDSDGKVKKVVSFGQKTEKCSLNFTATEPDLEEYVGVYWISKYPYRPDDEHVGYHYG